MPFIDSKISVKMTEEKKETIKSSLGQLVSIIRKPESFLMVGIDDDYDLWFAGKKLEKGAYVEVSLFGNAGSDLYEKLTGAICELFEAELGIPKNAVYVTYHPITDWGWNGQNF